MRGPRPFRVVEGAMPEELLTPDVVTGCTQCEYLSRLYVGYRRMPEGARRRGQLMAFALQLWREHAAEHG
ncbi:hypothetical protein [Streptomyces cacaoi]